MSDYILTYSKIKFYPLEPVKADINIADIAHSLSLMTRANGHFDHFFSVAQHSINCYKEAKNQGYSERVQLGCLLHDASESYISDITRPVKRNLSEYCVIEERLQGKIYERFGLADLSREEQRLIKEVDDILLHFEFEVLMDLGILDIPPSKSMEHDFSQREFKSVEKEFLTIFSKLAG
ncbi:HD domain-containing protein [Desulfosporosinus sp. OT]|uniref:HD domain-containing protein n=1 Tax=Desulfosporosinus sp. OT TaxID=913865 RepID=UPI000223B2DA|nr:HD domain-containing protein [Desulfosporosinus sp. OT]EGW36704.1 HD domain protein [Desulfosporosinus sp. OT]